MIKNNRTIEKPHKKGHSQVPNVNFLFFSHSEEDNLPIKEIMPGPNGSIPTACMYNIPECLVCKYTFTELSRVLHILYSFPHLTSLHRVKGIPAVFLGSAQEASASAHGKIMK